ncbi:hypothetical protein LXL04_020298 [Taraxacum kok-saghyz]
MRSMMNKFVGLTVHELLTNTYYAHNHIGYHIKLNMIKLFQIKQKQMGNVTNVYGKSPSTNRVVGELRLYKDFTELRLPASCEISFPNGKDDFMNYDFTIKHAEGFYRGGAFLFRVNVGNMYPHFPPSVRCVSKVCHPYIDTDGNKPVLTISQIVDGIYRLFTATFTSFESNMLDLTMGDYGGSSSSEKVYIPPASKNLKLKRTYVYISSMDNIYPSKDFEYPKMSDFQCYTRIRKSRSHTSRHKTSSSSSQLLSSSGIKMVEFTVGNRVEVIGHEDGYWNSYFAAIVVRVDQHKILVRYEELIDDFRQRLEEEVDIQHIRPYPSVVDHTISLGDDVDAFDGAGFWRGKVILNRQHDLMVYFGYMVRNQRQRNISETSCSHSSRVLGRSNMFHYEPGMRVEVIYHDDGYVKSYYAATVVRSDQQNVLVSYEERFNHNGQHLEEEVDVEHIRPYPPIVEHYLNEGDNVDVFFPTWLSISPNILEIIDTSHMQETTFAYIKNGLMLAVILPGSIKVLSPQTIITFKPLKILITKCYSNIDTCIMLLVGVTIYTFQVGDRVEVIQDQRGFEILFLQPLYESLVDINDDAFQEENTEVPEQAPEPQQLTSSILSGFGSSSGAGLP